MRPGRVGPGYSLGDGPRGPQVRRFNEAGASRPRISGEVPEGLRGRLDASMRPGRVGPGYLVLVASQVADETLLQ